MDILVLGGTGAMGVPLVNLLAQKDNNLFVTTRSKRTDEGNIRYLQGNAKQTEFFHDLMTRSYDVIIDFMVYGTDEFRNRLPVLLEHTKQYFFFSSSRCYAESDRPITEDSPRLVDVCDDREYILTDEYGLAKGREENILFHSERKNWTIIRPYITYNSYRIQLGVYEKENWLRRGLEGRTIVFPKDIADRKTSLTFGPDVAGAVMDLIGNERALGQAFHITTEESHTWGEILEFYCGILEKRTGKKPKVKMIEDSKRLQTVWNKWQILYDRLFDRTFDNSKIESIRGNYTFKPTFEGLEECMDEFLDSPKWLGMNVKYEAWCDKQCGEFTPLREILGKKNKIQYLLSRFLGGK